MAMTRRQARGLRMSMRPAIAKRYSAAYMMSVTNFGYLYLLYESPRSTRSGEWIVHALMSSTTGGPWKVIDGVADRTRPKPREAVEFILLTMMRHYWKSRANR